MWDCACQSAERGCTVFEGRYDVEVRVDNASFGAIRMNGVSFL